MDACGKVMGCCTWTSVGRVMGYILCSPCILVGGVMDYVADEYSWEVL